MGEIIDENSGEEPSCVFCDSKDSCPHLVAVIDRTFAQCSGGKIYNALGEFRDIVKEIAFIQSSSAEFSGLALIDSGLGEMVRDALERRDPDDADEVFIDEGAFLDWIVGELMDAGAEEPDGYFVEEGGPGQSSALTLLYAEDPSDVIGRLASRLNQARRLFAPVVPPVEDAPENGVARSDATIEMEDLPHEEMLSATICEPPASSVKLRPVLIVVPKWPDGTMAMKFGSVLFAALGVERDKFHLIQMGPERIFRTETSVSELEFREALSSRDVTAGIKTYFIEIGAN